MRGLGARRGLAPAPGGGTRERSRGRLRIHVDDIRPPFRSSIARAAPALATNSSCSDCTRTMRSRAFLPSFTVRCAVCVDAALGRCHHDANSIPSLPVPPAEMARIRKARKGAYRPAHACACARPSRSKSSPFYTASGRRPLHQRSCSRQRLSKEWEGARTRTSKAESRQGRLALQWEPVRRP